MYMLFHIFILKFNTFSTSFDQVSCKKLKDHFFVGSAKNVSTDLCIFLIQFPQ